MLQFCSQCTPEWYDKDLFQIALNLDNGQSVSFICEGCTNRGVYKDEKGLLYIAKTTGKEIKLNPITIEELIK